MKTLAIRPSHRHSTTVARRWRTWLVMTLLWSHQWSYPLVPRGIIMLPKSSDTCGDAYGPALYRSGERPDPGGRLAPGPITWTRGGISGQAWPATESPKTLRRRLLREEERPRPAEPATPG